MERVPEPELMTEEEQARAYAEADFAEPHERFVSLLRASLPDLSERGFALDLGCGPGDVTLRFARSFPGWEVHGLDGSAAMLRYGRAAVARAGLGGRVRLLPGLLPGARAPRERYDLVFSNSLLHHLADPQVLWAGVLRWVPPGAAVFVMDLLRPESRERARELLDVHAADAPPVLRRDFFRSLLAAYRIGEVQGQLRLAGLDHLAVAPASDRHWIAWGRR